jgi:hypothetical protein
MEWSLRKGSKSRRNAGKKLAKSSSEHKEISRFLNRLTKETSINLRNTYENSSIL